MVKHQKFSKYYHLGCSSNITYWISDIFLVKAQSALSWWSNRPLSLDELQNLQRNLFLTCSSFFLSTFGHSLFIKSFNERKIKVSYSFKVQWRKTRRSNSKSIRREKLGREEVREQLSSVANCLTSSYTGEGINVWGAIVWRAIIQGTIAWRGIIQGQFLLGAIILEGNCPGGGGNNPGCRTIAPEENCPWVIAPGWLPCE